MSAMTQSEGDRLVYLAGVSNCFSTKYMRLNTPSHTHRPIYGTLCKCDCLHAFQHAKNARL